MINCIFHDIRLKSKDLVKLENQDLIFLTNIHNIFFKQNMLPLLEEYVYLHSLFIQTKHLISCNNAIMHNEILFRAFFIISLLLNVFEM